MEYHLHSKGCYVDLRMAQKTLRLSDAANEDLNHLRLALKAEYGLTSRNQDLASALIWGTTIPQAAGMLMAFNRAMEEVDAAERDG